MGSKGFVEKTKAELGILAKGRMVRRHEETYELREMQATYSDYSDVKNGSLRPENNYFGNIFHDISI